MIPVVLGIDPGFRCMGLARVVLWPDREIVDATAVFRTKQGKRGESKTEDCTRRVGELATALERYLHPDVVAICTEAQSWPRNASSAYKIGFAWGAVIALAEIHAIPILQATPMELKRAVTGDKHATKDDVRHALELRYPDMPDWPTPNGIVEHAADALGAIVACLDRELLVVARRHAPSHHAAELRSIAAGGAR